jgi:4-carboxymuconolactone decarboxylase
LTSAFLTSAVSAAPGETNEQRFARGMEFLRTIGGENFDLPIKRPAQISPDLARFVVEFAYGDVLSRPGLELRLRQVTTVSALIAEGSVQPQLKYHMAGFLNVGGQPRELVEILFVAAAVLGFPAAINAVGIVREIFKDKKIAFEPLAPMTDDGTGRYQRGLTALAKLTGGDSERVTKSLEAVSPDLARWTVEFAYGDLLFRDGLDMRAKQIAIISMLAAVGNRDEALHLNIEGALNQGVKREEILEAFAQLSIYAGFPAALNALALAEAVFKEIDQRPTTVRAPVTMAAVISEGRKERFDRGLAVLRKTSAAAGTAVVDSPSDLAPDIGKLIVEHSYGDIFSRPGLEPKMRELAACSAMAAVATATAVVPLRVHVNAALTAGATPAEVIETLLNLIPYCGYPVAQQAVKVAHEEIARRQAQ